MTTDSTRKLLNNWSKKHKVNLLQITVSNIPKLLIEAETWRGKEDCILYTVTHVGLSNLFILQIV